MGTDDFSFPTITDSIPNYTKSTSLWRVPSAVFIESFNENDKGGGGEDLCALKTEVNPHINSEEREDSSTFKFKQNSKGDGIEKRETSSTLETEENSEGDYTGVRGDSSTNKTDENSEGDNARGRENSSTIKTEENSEGDYTRGKKDSSTIKTDENFQRNTSLLTVSDSMRSIDEEEKMDMLWENFNDIELRRISSLNKKKEMGKLLGSEFDTNNYEDKVELSCVGSGTILSPARPSLLVILKVLKKLFLLQNAHCPKRNTSIDLF